MSRSCLLIGFLLLYLPGWSVNPSEADSPVPTVENETAPLVYTSAIARFEGFANQSTPSDLVWNSAADSFNAASLDDNSTDQVASTRCEQAESLTAGPLTPKRLYFKTNLVGWALAVTNLAIEVDLTDRWSALCSVYYSGWDYFHYCCKFRNTSFYPELRYHITTGEKSLYVGAHFGCAYYNFSFAGGRRYQDHERRNPALGGGITVGYRLPLDHSGHWHVCFEAGFGIYALNYDIINNPGNDVVANVHSTRYDIDTFSITFSYALNLTHSAYNK